MLRFLWREENTENPEKNPPNKARTNNKLNLHMAPGRNRNRATLVRGERSLTTAPSLLPSMLLTVEISSFQGCDSKSGVCQHVGTQVYNAGKANSRLYFDDGVLYLNLSGGDPCHHVKKNRETIIQFVCNSTLRSSDLGQPVFISENDCTYYIVWHTPLVCEKQVRTKHLRLEA